MSNDGNSLNVLAIDDDPYSIRLLQEMMADLSTPVTLHSCPDGNAGLAFLANKTPFESAPRPDYVLLDLKMPGMDGFEFLQRVQGDPALAESHIVVLTSSAHPSDIRRAYQLGARLVITKTVTIDDFADLLADMEEYWNTQAAVA